MTITDQYHHTRFIVLDIDGVLADGAVSLTDKDAPIRTMHSSDAIALQECARSSVGIAIITGGSSVPALERIEKLGVKLVFAGVRNKAEQLKELATAQDIDLATTLYMGDDVPDLEAMNLCGFKVCPSNAAVDIKRVADVVVNRKGGEGAVRWVIERVLRAKNEWTYGS